MAWPRHVTGAAAYRLPDGRLHLQHGPMDLICEAWGPANVVDAGYLRAWQRFSGLLHELVAELPALRREDVPLQGDVARLMGQAVAAFRPGFITPMAAVAGAVADTILQALLGAGIARAYVNNGGDIAVFLAEGEVLNCAIAGCESKITLRAKDGIGGIATSGWSGRSWSFGIADSVSVLASTAAEADAAATMIANAVDLPGHPAIARRPAIEMQADTDLGARRVTVGVGRLQGADVARALTRGAAAADTYRARGLIQSAALFLQDDCRIVGPLTLKEPAFA